MKRMNTTVTVASLATTSTSTPTPFRTAPMSSRLHTTIAAKLSATYGLRRVG